MAWLSLASIEPRPAASQAEATKEDAGAQPTAPDLEQEDTETLAPRAVAAMPAETSARRAWLARELAAAIAARPALAGARIGFAAIELPSGEPLWQHQGDVALPLASNAKLFTAAAALTRLGPGHVWLTSLYGAEAPRATAEDERDDTLETLYLRGQGDPTLEPAALRSLIDDLTDRGIRKIRKELVIDTSAFDAVSEPPHFAEQPKEQAAFRAPVAALSLSRNAVTVVVSAPPGSDVPSVRLDPAVDELFELRTDELVLTEDGKTRLRIDVGKKAKRGKLELRLSGQLRADAPPTYRRLRIEDPVAFAGAILRAELAAHGIRAPAKVLAGVVPPDARLWASHESPALAEVVRRMNKTSDNFLAEMIFKTLGKPPEVAGAPAPAATSPASWPRAAAAMTAFLAERGLGGVRIDNGSGLFDSSAGSASQLAALLASVLRDFRIAPDFIASLPIGGIDGTLRSRFARRPAAGLVRAKTGTLAKVSTLAGYVGLDSSRLAAFAVLCADLAPAQRREARALQEDLVDLLALYLGAPPVAVSPAEPANR